MKPTFTKYLVKLKKITELQENMHKGNYSISKKKRNKEKRKKISKEILTKLHFCSTFREKTTTPINICLAEKQLLKT